MPIRGLLRQRFFAVTGHAQLPEPARCGGKGGSGEVVHHEAWMLGMLCYSQRNGKRSLSWASAKQKFSRLNFKDKASLKQSLNTHCVKLPLTEGLRELKHTPSTYNLDKGFHLEAKRTNLWHVGDFDSHSGKHTNLFFFLNTKCEISLKKVKIEVSNLRCIIQLLILAPCVGAALT